MLVTKILHNLQEPGNIFSNIKITWCLKHDLVRLAGHLDVKLCSDCAFVYS